MAGTTGAGNSSTNKSFQAMEVDGREQDDDDVDNDNLSDYDDLRPLVVSTNSSLNNSVPNRENSTSKTSFIANLSSWSYACIRRNKVLLLVSIFSIMFIYYTIIIQKEDLDNGASMNPKVFNNTYHAIKTQYTMRRRKKFPKNDNKNKASINIVQFQKGIETIHKQFYSAVKNYKQSLEVDYGKVIANTIFPYAVDSNLTNGNNIDDEQMMMVFPRISSTTKTNYSYNVAKRKMILKILQSFDNNETNDNDNDSNNGSMTQFVWVTGGHSATAGHGNFYNESYTSILGNVMKPIFQLINNISFIAKNYAMGGTSSGPEITFCSNEIFGQDIDVIVWDYGMTDNTNVERLLLYLYKITGYNPGRPIGIVYHANGHSEGIRRTTASSLETMYKLPILFSDERLLDKILQQHIPDTIEESSSIQNMPKFVRNFKCGKDIESGDNVCAKDKYNDSMCTDRKYKAGWHPGWKWHALMGNLAAMFLIRLLNDALYDINDTIINSYYNGMHDPITQYRDQLEQEEDNLYTNLITRTIPPIDAAANLFIEKKRKTIPNQEQVRSIEETTMLLNLITNHTFCHTARLPAEIRYKGILTQSYNNNQTGFTSYDTGISETKAKLQKQASDASTGPSDIDSKSSNSILPLVYLEKERYSCPIPTIMDCKDFFYVSTSNTPKWMGLTLPTDDEYKEYGTSKNMIIKQAMVGFCLRLCSWGKCEKGELQHDDLMKTIVDITTTLSTGNSTAATKTLSTKFQMQVNGIDVVGVRKMSDCAILLQSSNNAIHNDNDNNNKNKIDINEQQYSSTTSTSTSTSTSSVWDANNRGQFLIETKVNVPKSFVRFSSFLLWEISSQQQHQQGR